LKESWVSVGPASMRAKGERRMPPPCRPVSIHLGALAALLDPLPPLRKAVLVAPGKLQTDRNQHRYGNAK
jgi:hypothetical protein